MAWLKDVPYRNQADPRWEALVNNLKEAAEEAPLGNEGVTTAKIKAEAVTEAKLASKAVGAEKTTQATVPEPSATENEKVLGGGGVARTLMVAYTGNGAETKVKIKHSFAKQGVMAVAMKAVAKLPAEQPTTALGKWVNESATEGTYTFTAAPAGKEEMFILVIG